MANDFLISRSCLPRDFPARTLGPEGWGGGADGSPFLARRARLIGFIATLVNGERIPPRLVPAR